MIKIDLEKYKNLKLKCLIDSAAIEKRITQMAAEIDRDFAGESVYFVGILKGAFVFLTDLCRKIKIPCECAFMAVSSYGNEKVSSGKVKITKDIEEDVEGRNVIIVEDIVDTGITLNFLREYMLTRRPKSLRICTLLSKTECRLIDVKVEYMGFEIPNKFVVGYGLDYEQFLRNLPYIATVEE